MKIVTEIAWFAFATSAAVFLRLCTSLHPYSGQGKRPMYGDYEAQRHWMEITVNLPMNQWYHNSSQNDLNYWGLDYPPLTAYHSYLNGLIAWVINPAYVELETSRGYESDNHKLFMRYTVLLSDILIYIPAIVLFYLSVAQREYSKSKVSIHAAVTIALLYPGIILIDHGHFQYNCISLGFTILSVAALTMEFDLIASVLFVLAVNYKQMELYHAFPFFLYLLSSCIPKPGAPAVSGIAKLLKIAATVLATFGVLWLPFLFKIEDTLQLVHRLFPVARGVFEDKVANVWCTLNIFYKFKSYCSGQMVRYCTIATLTAILPSSANLFLGPSINKFVPSLINSSLAFFLFSYQVHEKSILLAAIPVMLYLPEKPLQCFWFLYFTNFSMLPLFIKDRLIVAYLALTIFYVTMFVYCGKHWHIENKSRHSFAKLKTDLKLIIYEKLISGKNNGYTTRQLLKVTYKRFINDLNMLRDLSFYGLMTLSFLGSIVLTALILMFDAPKQYPDLYTLMIAVYCCVHFLGFFIYFNVVQFMLPHCFESISDSRCTTKKLKRA